MRWNPDPEDVQKSVVKLVLSLIEFIRKLMERQAVRRLEEKTLSAEDLASFEKFLGMLNDCDDVQEIFHNVSLP